MSYIVLARKWRPRRFEEFVGQRHVVTALVNSLAAERVHHAYLFAGTRGVGKTTVARILAKALNCAEGIVPEPCGACEACVAIDEGRFVDLLEVDAASRTKVDDTRDLLDNVQYAPTTGRFKVYLIDEVHMLSKHSFNALLKTLEEPPPHVKFLLATTDPQKLPVTVLSRCLQFNLKRLTLVQIQEQLQKICTAEEVQAEPSGLTEIARGADGSMRDALSLLDQAIAFCGGTVSKESVDAMLGTIDRQHVIRLLEGLAKGDSSALLKEIARVDEFAPDYATILDELMGELQRLAVIQLVGRDEMLEEQEALLELAEAISAEDVQLYYQIAVQGRKDLDVCRDRRSGVEMTLLRMVAFRPNVTIGGGGNAVTGVRPPDLKPTVEDTSKSALKASPSLKQKTLKQSEQVPKTSDLAESKAGEWGRLLSSANISGAARQLAEHCTVEKQSDDRIVLILAEENAYLNTPQVKGRLEAALREHLGRELRLNIGAGSTRAATPAELREAGEDQRIRNAREAIEQDPNVRAVQAAFDAVLEADSIQPAENKTTHL